VEIERKMGQIQPDIWIQDDHEFGKTESRFGNQWAENSTRIDIRNVMYELKGE